METRYQMVSTRFWWDERMRAQSLETKLLALYLLTNPHHTISGYYYLPLEYAVVDVGFVPEPITKPVEELLAEPFMEPFPEPFRKALLRLPLGFLRAFGALLGWFIEYDFERSIVLVLNALKYNPPDNPNQVKAVVRRVLETPSSPLLERLLAVSERYCKPLAERLREELRNPSETHPQTHPEYRTPYSVIRTPYINTPLSPHSGDGGDSVNPSSVNDKAEPEPGNSEGNEPNRRVRAKKPGRQATDPRVKPVIDHFYERYKAEFGSPPVIQGGRDGQLIRSLPTEYDAGRICQIMDKWFERRDEGWLWRNGDIPSFVRVFNRLVSQEKPREHAPPWLDDEHVSEDNV